MALLAGQGQLHDPLAAAFCRARHELFEATVPIHKGAAWFLRVKSLVDPAYLELLRRIPANASLLDVGGGEGLLPMLHALMHGGQQPRTVLDWDVRKLEFSAKAAKSLGLPLETLPGDARTLELPPRDCVVCVDLLHYFPEPEQDRLLDRIGGSVVPGGTLLLRDIDGGSGLRSFLTLMQERWSRLISLQLGAGLHPRPAAATVERLSRLGFDVDVVPNWGRTPYANVLFVARRRGAAAAA
jgi:SAM-dependent methyltransferase